MKLVKRSYTFSLTFSILPRKLRKLDEGGYFIEDGWGIGILVRREQDVDIWWHRPEQYLKWINRISMVGE